MGKIEDYKQLIKFTLSFTVVFSSVIAYMLAPNVVEYDFASILLLLLGGMLVTGSANAINQITEKDTDAVMKRTGNRPVASGRMSVQEATAFAFIAAIIGSLILWLYFSWYAAGLALLSLFIYGFVYTPLKKVNSIAVLVGAIPGALPCLIGWAAAYDGENFSWTGGWILFAIQFLWQFPHFWAIAWVAHTDYSKAGFKLLPSQQGPTKFTAIQTVIYSLLMIPVGMLPFFFNMSGVVSMWILVAANLFMVIQCVRLYFNMDVKNARRVMFSSYIYLPIVLLALLADKIAQ
ncbi:protoheme IX farnesyltransferase [Lacibacter sediminis]|uniref:Protoheme IX farnesyltransferase n=2 Tax=Lacibacter sediminis TaxID=2760713 RepID=A0A7G5XN15_9BACT|nr:protoheme IX farnesyltransferase [Lacibacter sediminis]